MSTAGRTRGELPDPPVVSPEAIRAQLERILASPLLEGSESLPRFLRFTVEETLQGRSSRIKEYLLGAEVFRRGEAFDSRLDSIVRVEARRLRAKLEEYYQTDGRNDPVRIELPKGSYVPVFREVEPARRRRWQHVGIAAAILVMAGAGLWWRLADRDDRLSLVHGPSPSVAVLSFSNLSGDKDQDYFCEGITEEITNALSKVSGLRVAARTSASRFRGKSEDVRQIARQLNVSAILEGSVRRTGGTLRITAQLVNGSDGYHLWSEEYERGVENVFVVQDEIALAIVKALRVKLRAETPPPAHTAGNLESYDLYLKGRLWSKGRKDTAPLAIGYFEQALARDPRFARAYIGLANLYISLAAGAEARPRDVLPKAKEAVSKALALDDTLSEAHAAWALIERNGRNWTGAERAWRKAIQLDPNFGLHSYALHLADMGRTEEALAEVARIRSVDPLIETEMLGLQARILYFGRRYEAALDHCRKALAASPEDWEVLYWLGRIRASQSLYPEAIEVLEKSRRLRQHYRGLGSGMLGYTYARAGRRADALKLLAELKTAAAEAYVSPVSIGHVYIGLGDADQAFQWLAQAERDGDQGLATLRVEPAFDPIRSDPRFDALVERMNLTQNR